MKQLQKTKPHFKIMSTKKENTLWIIAIVIWVCMTLLGIYIIWSNS